MYALSQHPECDQYFKSNKKISKETEKILNSKPLNSSDYRPEDYGQTIQFKWGYYNKDTENMVKEFQKQYNLVVDGIAGKNTFKKIKNLVENAIVKITDTQGNIVYETKALGGQAVWNGRKFNGDKVSSGVYLVKLGRTGEKGEAKKLVVTKV
jgi:peptidoglycan hydrolase-like protein with peptidoglycan-binding domain